VINESRKTSVCAGWPAERESTVEEEEEGRQEQTYHQEKRESKNVKCQ
jgi:hypothetical protein